MAAWDKSDPVTVTSAVSKFLQFISSDTLSFTPNPPPHPANPKVCTDRQRPINCGLDTFLHSTFSECYVFIILPKKVFFSNVSFIYTRVCRRKRKQCDTIPSVAPPRRFCNHTFARVNAAFDVVNVLFRRDVQF